MLLDDAIRFDFKPRERFPPQQTAQSIPSALFAAAVAAVADRGGPVRNKLWSGRRQHVSPRGNTYDQSPIAFLAVSRMFSALK